MDYESVQGGGAMRNRISSGVVFLGLVFLLLETVVSEDKKELPFPTLPKNAGKIEVGASKSFTETPSGLQYRVLRKGDGRKPQATQKVKVHYHGWLEGGKVFDSSYNRGETISFGLNQVIKGWTEGMQLVGEGGMIELTIPANLGYGERGAAGVIPGGATLHFLVELIAIE